VDDEIYQRYLDRAIAEANRLEAEIADCSGCQRGDGPRPVLGSGHPMSEVLLLKYRARRSEWGEGVAFFGRAGDAVLKSVHKLSVDPLAIYGTNCLKCPHDQPETARMRTACGRWVVRELALVDPKMVVVMGEATVAFLNELALPLAEEIAYEPGVIQRFTPTVSCLVTPDIDESLDTTTAKGAFWRALQPLGEWYSQQPPY
jgi:uracil-DNA glycosylase family 4